MPDELMPYSFLWPEYVRGEVTVSDNDALATLSGEGAYVYTNRPLAQNHQLIFKVEETPNDWMILCFSTCDVESISSKASHRSYLCSRIVCGSTGVRRIKIEAPTGTEVRICRTATGISVKSSSESAAQLVTNESGLLKDQKVVAGVCIGGPWSSTVRILPDTMFLSTKVPQQANYLAELKEMVQRMSGNSVARICSASKKKIIPKRAHLATAVSAVRASYSEVKRIIMTVTPAVLLYQVASWLPILLSDIGARLTQDATRGKWYTSLKKPPFNPPDWVFPVVPRIVSILMLIASILIYISEKGLVTDTNRAALTLYFVQVVLHACWYPLFFLTERIGLALLWIVAVDVAVAWTTVKFMPINATAAYLFVPYLLWCLFATLLNYSIWLLNYECLL